METVKIVRETLEGLFDLRLALPEEIVQAAASGLDRLLQQCASEFQINI